MKKFIWVLYFLTIWSCTAIAAKKSYDVIAEQFEFNETTIERVKFSLTEIATAAGFSSSSAMQEAMQSNHIFWGNDTIGGGDLTNDYTHVSGGFYFSADGYVVPRDNEKSRYYKPYFFSYFRTDTIKDEFVCYIGQKTELCEAGDTFLTQVYLINGQDTVVFNITLSIKESTQILPTPTTLISQLNIIGETDVHVTITTKSETHFRVGVKEIAEVFGVDMSIPQTIEYMLYACGININTLKRTDMLVSYAKYGIFVFKEENSDDDTAYPCAACPTRGNYFSDCFTIYNLYYEPSSETLVGTIHPEHLNNEAGEQHKTELYIVYGNKAHRINIHTYTAEHKLKRIEEYECVGKRIIKMERTPKWSSSTFDIDVNLITENLKCLTSELIVLTSDENNYVNGSFFSTLDVFISRSKTFKITASPKTCEGVDINYSITFNAEQEQMTMSLNSITSIPKDSSIVHHFPVLFVYDNKFYEIEVITTFTSDVIEFDDGTEVGSENIYIQLPEPKMTQSPDRGKTIAIDYSLISELTGTDNPELFVYKKQGNTMKTNDFHMQIPNRSISFYMEEDGYRMQDSVLHQQDTETELLYLTYYLSYHTLYSLLKNTIGTTYTGSLFFVNTENKKYYTINYTIEPVDEAKNTKYVGEEEIILPIGKATISRTEFDTGKAMEALGITDVQQLREAEWQASRSDKSTFLYANTGYDEAKGGFPFNVKGCLEEEEENIAFHVGYAQEGEKHYLTSASASALEDGQEYTTRLALDYGENRYIFHVRLMNEKTYTALHGIKAEHNTEDETIYDLSGRIVGRGKASAGGLEKGVYIRNGKKFVVK